jgi:hypothetical protein
MDPRFWQMERLSEKTARRELERAAASLPEAPSHTGGRGIVIPGGGEKYLPGALLAAGLLRRLGCTLPIEIWHLGAPELPPRWQAPLAAVGARSVDALAVQTRHPVRRLGGFELKAFSLAYTELSDVLLLDADNVPTRDPTFLFESAEYRKLGAIFWPDYGPSRGSLATGPLSESHPIWALTGVPYRGDREFESGQVCIDKTRCHRELMLALWINQYSDFWYRYLWGDKDTFHLAWRKLGREWAMPARGPIDLMGRVMGQCDFEGRVLFQHRHGAKWSLHDNPRIAGFIHEDVCFQIIAELRETLRDGVST